MAFQDFPNELGHHLVEMGGLATTLETMCIYVYIHIRIQCIIHSMNFKLTCFIWLATKMPKMLCQTNPPTELRSRHKGLVCIGDLLPAADCFGEAGAVKYPVNRMI